MQVELRKLNTGSSIHMPNVHLLMCSGLLLGYHLHNSWHYYFFLFGEDDCCLDFPGVLQEYKITL